MNDPIIGRMDFGFAICAVATFLWASIDYNRFIKFWMGKPAPYNRRVIVFFRVFFFACVLGGLWQVARIMLQSPRPAMFYLSALPFAAAWFGVFILMLKYVEQRMRQRGRAK